MFRLYSLPRSFDPSRSEDTETFYQKKRLLSAHAARAYPKKAMRAGRAVEMMNYLMISALALDTRPGACAALNSGRCGIYDRRPLACRTVPFHYSRADGLAETDFDAFVNTPGYHCDVGAKAPVVLDSGRIVDPDMRAARTQALVCGQQDKSWKEAIVGKMKKPGELVPGLDSIEANAAFGAMTTSMGVAWRIAADAGLITGAECKANIATQAATIERELAVRECASEDRQTLHEMQLEYGQMLGT
jgi:Fe-S-cluster containining protein